MVDNYLYSDFDGTITYKDSFTSYILKYGNKLLPLICLPVFIIVILLYFMKVVSRNFVKRVSIFLFLTGRNYDKLKAKHSSFVKTIKLNDETLNLIKKYKSEGYKVILVSASPEMYLEEVCKLLNYDGYIGSKLEVKNGKLTGRLVGNNNNYDEKVTRIKSSEYYDKNVKTVAIGNSKGDYAMLRFSNEGYIVKDGRVTNFLK